MVGPAIKGGYIRTGEPITLCLPMVVQPKPMFRNIQKDKLKPNQIRASIDLRVPKKSMERNRITPVPIAEDCMYKLYDCKVFSKLDMRQGYHQLILDPSSREIATFSTPRGKMRPKRLLFDAKSSQDLFDEAVCKVFSRHTKCHISKRRHPGGTLEVHNETLTKVLERAAEHNVTFNRKKCEFGVTELEFYEYKFTKDGLKSIGGEHQSSKRNQSSTRESKKLS
ncbi:hypothetical protein HOLleu_12275 [Holothuria leucospilota]|uniref:Reverse transcriptase domain-containing protein n=1 Tax=Holothuria leucospilota TaxID=206669 RepID=A0A9Q1CAM4_HOLLE|nr:hypothetical protein HOLleu_12275 [Holothuria leucospilota]